MLGPKQMPASGSWIARSMASIAGSGRTSLTIGWRRFDTDSTDLMCSPAVRSCRATVRGLWFTNGAAPRRLAASGRMSTALAGIGCPRSRWRTRLIACALLAASMIA
jgi:hypothetical protein